MRYKIWVTKDGIPQPGAVLAWESLAAMDGTDKSGSAPAFTQVSAANAPGQYYFKVKYGTAPFDVPELVGHIDCDSDEALGLSDHERYHPVLITLRDLAWAKLVNKMIHDLATGQTTLRNDDDDDDELTFNITEEDNEETRETS